MPLPILDQTLNPLPNSVNLSSTLFGQGKYIGSASLLNGAYILFSTFGDLTNDGYPEIVLTGWNADGSKFGSMAGTPNAAPLSVFSTSASNTVKLGVSTINGTTQPRIIDINNDGLNDFLYIAHNEAPNVPMSSQIFIQNLEGTFAGSLLNGPTIASHNSATGDFNGDEYVDIVASAYELQNYYYSGNGLPVDQSGNISGLMLYINDKRGNFTPYLLSTNASGSVSFNGGSASAMADFNSDGKMDIVIVDSPNSQNDWGQGSNQNDAFIVSKIQLNANGLASGDLHALPSPYFEDVRFSSLSSAWNQRSHDIKVDAIDINNDGLPDIAINSIVWNPTDNTGTQAGMLQILINKGDFQFEDVTNSSIYNYYLGSGATHASKWLDVNHDGFVDLIAMDGLGQSYQDATGAWVETAHSWSNKILINTGSGKFVVAAWNQLHDWDVSEAGLQDVPTEYGTHIINLDRTLAPYLLPDGRLGFITQQSGWDFSGVNGAFVDKEYFFDLRMSSPLSTGPNGINPALLGVPGYSEYYYLTENPDVVTAINSGTYRNGLEHYLAIGETEGRQAFAANANIKGSDQVDTLCLNGVSTDFVLNLEDGNGIIDDDSGARYGTLQLVSIERISFENKNLAFDIHGAAGDTMRLLNAFGGVDAMNHKYWVGAGLSLFDGGMTIGQVSELVVNAGIVEYYAGSDSDEDFIDLIYHNVVGQEPDAATVAGFVSYMRDNNLSKASILTAAAETDINAATIDLVGIGMVGIEYLMA